MQEEAGQTTGVWWTINHSNAATLKLLLDTQPEPTDGKEQKRIQA